MAHVEDKYIDRAFAETRAKQRRKLLEILINPRILLIALGGAMAGCGSVLGINPDIQPTADPNIYVDTQESGLSSPTPLNTASEGATTRVSTPTQMSPETPTVISDTETFTPWPTDTATAILPTGTKVYVAPSPISDTPTPVPTDTPPPPPNIRGAEFCISIPGGCDGEDNIDASDGVGSILTKFVTVNWCAKGTWFKAFLVNSGTATELEAIGKGERPGMSLESCPPIP